MGARRAGRMALGIATCLAIALASTAAFAAEGRRLLPGAESGGDVRAQGRTGMVETAPARPTAIDIVIRYSESAAAGEAGRSLDDAAATVAAMASSVGAPLSLKRRIDARTHIVAIAGGPSERAVDALLERIQAHPDVTDAKRLRTMQVQESDNGEATDSSEEADGDVKTRRGEETGATPAEATGRAVEAISPSPDATASVGSLAQAGAAETPDPRFGEQWHFSEPVAGIGVETAWEMATGADVVVAVLDTGVLPHRDLLDNLLPGFDFISDPALANDGDGRDPEASDPGDWCMPFASTWHGTHVAGTIAAMTGNGIDVAGVSRGAKILPVRVLGACGGDELDVADGIRWAAGLPVDGVPDNETPAKVLNLSLAAEGACGFIYQDAIDAAVAAGATVVVSAGNFRRDAASFAPGNCDNVLTVAAVNRLGGRAHYSNYGTPVDLAAPGGELDPEEGDGILSTANAGLRTPEGDVLAFQAGTSMAAPHVSAVVAMLYEAVDGLTQPDVIEILTETARPFPANFISPCLEEICGAGILDAAEALAFAMGTTQVALAAEAGAPAPAMARRRMVVPVVSSAFPVHSPAVRQAAPDPEAAPRFESAPRMRARSLETLSTPGGAADPQRYGSVVEIARPGSDVAGCSGTLIGPDLVVTARHCYYWGVAGEVRAAGGDGRWVSVADVVLPTGDQRRAGPPYDDPANPDVVLYRLAEPLPGPSPADLADTPEGSEATLSVVGFGRHSMGIGGLLQQSAVALVSERCAREPASAAPAGGDDAPVPAARYGCAADIEMVVDPASPVPASCSVDSGAGVFAEGADDGPPRLVAVLSRPSAVPPPGDDQGTTGQARRCGAQLIAVRLDGPVGAFVAGERDAN